MNMPCLHAQFLHFLLAHFIRFFLNKQLFFNFINTVHARNFEVHPTFFTCMQFFYQFFQLLFQKSLNFFQIFFIVDNLTSNFQTSWLHFIRFTNESFTPHFNHIRLVFFEIIFVIILFAFLSSLVRNFRSMSVK